MRKNGAVVLFDFDFKQQQRMEFFNALISEVNFPACDAGSKDAAFISLKMRPEYTRMAATTAKGSQKSSSISAGQKAAKMRAANFSLTIGDLDCPGVTAIEAFTVKQRFTESVGEVRDYEFEPGALDVSNLAVTFAENSKNIFQDWFDDFVIKGNNNQSNERNGKLEYLSANLKDVLFTVTFLNLGIFKLERQKFEASSDRIRTVRAEMYCEQITFKPGPDVSAAQSSNLQPFVDSAGSSLTPSGSSGSGAGVSTPVYVVPYVPSVADKLQVPQLPQELAVGAPPRLGRPLKFRS